MTVIPQDIADVERAAEFVASVVSDVSSDEAAEYQRFIERLRQIAKRMEGK